MCFQSFLNKIPTISQLIFTFLGVSLWHDFRNHRKKVRSEAATCIMVLIKSSMDYIKEIADNWEYYSYKGYYPDHVPEIFDKKNTASHWERPSRLILNRLYFLQGAIRKYLAQVGESESKKLLTLLSDLQRTAKNISNSIAAQMHATDEIAKETEPWIKEGCKKIIEIEKQIEVILMPIIKGQGTIFYFRSRIKNFYKAVSLKIMNPFR